MEFHFDKLKHARKVLDLSQQEAASESGLLQKDISMLEGGKKEFIPIDYILFLYNHGIDLNTIFDSSLDVKLQGSKDEISEPSFYKNELITTQKELIKIQAQQIEELKQQIDVLKRASLASDGQNASNTGRSGEPKTA